MTENHHNLSENDMKLIKELIGSAMYFSILDDYLTMMEEKLKTASGWVFLRIVKFDPLLKSFVSRKLQPASNYNSLGFFSFESPLIQEVLITGTTLKELKGPFFDIYERKIVEDGITHVCLSPIMQKSDFVGVIAGFADKSPKGRDCQLLDLAAEIVAVSQEIFQSNAINEEIHNQLKEYQDQLISYESLKILGDLAAGVSHNLNNLLAGILAYIQLIGNRLTDPETKKILNEIRSAAMAGKETVRSLQEFKKMNLDMDFETVQLSEIIKRAVHLTRSKWQDEAWAKSIEYKFEIDIFDLKFVLGNPSTMLEAFIIAILSSLESIPNGGKITLETFQDYDYSGISLTSRADAGSGRSLTALDPFLGVPDGTDSNVNFNVAEEIIRRHHGLITREPIIGQGIKIKIRIPVIQKKMEEIKEQAESIEVIPAKILVVEDEPMVRSLINEVLLKEGFKVTTAENGEMALKALAEKKFDLIITDLGMPNMSGFDLAERVRKKLPDIPIIMATGWQAQLDQKKIEKYRIDYVVGKPFQIKDLVDSISSIISKRKKSPDPD